MQEIKEALHQEIYEKISSKHNLFSEDEVTVEAFWKKMLEEVQSIDSSMEDFRDQAIPLETINDEIVTPHEVSVPSKTKDNVNTTGEDNNKGDVWIIGNSEESSVMLAKLAEIFVMDMSVRAKRCELSASTRTCDNSNSESSISSFRVPRMAPKSVLMAEHLAEVVYKYDACDFLVDVTDTFMRRTLNTSDHVDGVDGDDNLDLKVKVKEEGKGRGGCAISGHW